MARFVRMAVPLAVLLALFSQSAAQAATTNVSIVDFAFSPATISVKLGGTVKWTNNGTTHTSTSDGFDACCQSGAGLWQSGPISHGGAFSFAFAAAGTFKYHCSIHPSMKGTVQVKVKPSPTSGTTSTSFTIQWAAGSVPSGYREDVQIMRPGSTAWQAWKSNQTGAQVSATFTPDMGTGTYQFRGRLTKLSDTTKKSGFSPAAKIQVS